MDIEILITQLSWIKKENLIFLCLFVISHMLKSLPITYCNRAYCTSWGYILMYPQTALNLRQTKNVMCTEHTRQLHKHTEIIACSQCICSL